MCLACQMEDELWAAYLDQMARQAAQPEQPEKPAAAPADAATKKAEPASPFACEELPPE